MTFLAVCEDYICEHYERQIEANVALARMHYEDWWHSVHPDKDHPAKPPRIDLEDTERCAEIMYRHGLASAEFGWRWWLAVVHGEPEPDPREVEFGDGDLLLSDMQASMLVGW